MTELELFLAEAWRGQFGGTVRRDPSALRLLGALPDTQVMTARVSVLGGRGDELLLACPVAAAARLSRSMRDDPAAVVSAEDAADAVRETVNILAGGAKSFLGIAERLGPPELLAPGRGSRIVEVCRRMTGAAEVREAQLLWDAAPVFIAWLRPSAVRVA